MEIPVHQAITPDEFRSMLPSEQAAWITAAYENIEHENTRLGGWKILHEIVRYFNQQGYQPNASSLRRLHKLSSADYDIQRIIDTGALELEKALKQFEARTKKLGNSPEVRTEVDEFIAGFRERTLAKIAPVDEITTPFSDYIAEKAGDFGPDEKEDLTVIEALAKAANKGLTLHKGEIATITDIHPSKIGISRIQELIKERLQVRLYSMPTEIETGPSTVEARTYGLRWYRSSQSHQPKQKREKQPDNRPHTKIMQSKSLDTFDGNRMQQELAIILAKAKDQDKKLTIEEITTIYNGTTRRTGAHIIKKALTNPSGLQFTLQSLGYKLQSEANKYWV